MHLAFLHRRSSCRPMCKHLKAKSLFLKGAYDQSVKEFEELISEGDEFLLPNYEYEIDGLVIADTSQVYSLIEGENPKYSFSFKSYLTEEKNQIVVH